MIRLSLIIPAYNEERTIGPLLEKIIALPIDKNRFQVEILVIDDGSQDNTAQIAASYQGVRCLRQANQGKGAAVQRGVQACTGDVLLVQDADLEYDPTDYILMLSVLPINGQAVVYGSRVLGQIKERGWSLFPGKHPDQGIGPWLANVLLSMITFLLYGRWLTDLLTAYKLYPTPWIREMKVKSAGFEADHEMTAKLIRRGAPILEVPIHYMPRTVAEGKKITAFDGLIAVWTLLKYRWG